VASATEFLTHAGKGEDEGEDETVSPRPARAYGASMTAPTSTSAASSQATAPGSAPRPTLEPSRIAPDAASRIAAFHPDVVGEVLRAIGESPVVVVGMAQNPHVKNVKKALTEAGVDFRYLEYGSYFAKWRERLAIKMWSGWPTFPQVFVRGVLVGGEDLTKAAIADGSLKAMLGAASS
jgi:monothiol glutaredoxin